MYRALRRFDPLPDAMPVYPTHGAGSFCSAPGSSSRTSTLGTERETNPMLRSTDEDEFVSRLLAGFGTVPTYFRRLPEVNRRGPARYDAIPTLDELDPVDVERLVNEGAVVVDGRPVAAFAAGHIPGALANTLRSVFASWIGWLVDPERPIVLVLDAEQSRDDAVRQCLDVGYEHLAGVLRGGMAEWAASGRPFERIALVGPDQLGDMIVDVRQHDEFASGHVPGAVNVELGAVADCELESRRVSVMCGHGERAMSAASILAARGYDVDVLDGGPDTWANATGRTLQRSQ
jgi:rhodanese-related sulfurtransferase